ncbi:branched-chain-amino-acid transaminase [Neorhodopirellula pilleata]|uniref:Branched-chain-amino-acid aminotransferase n=1 Tax=Neorhodopirellula pilleata TaxID=2714738 RepID=A0A5C6AWX8_9BACT|nr:branched-chain-amino-acid transaminase [Neorhodopirellula pilleata]TWU03981.1 Branched-chain-amino-acid aminotransferase [Neorhodopirellula pilleata]
MAQAIYINGEYFSREDAKISVYDHGLLYGDGVFEGMRIYADKVFALEDHLVRLYESARAIALNIPIDIDAMREAVNTTVAKNGLKEGYIRLVVTRGGNQLGLDPFRCDDPQVIIIVDSISLYPEKYYTEGLDLVTASTIRNHPAALSPRIKSLNYLNNIMAKIEAIRAGCVEAVMLNHKGEVAECTGDNIFIVRRGRLLTPPIHAGILEGITRNTVIELARKEGIEVAEETLTRHDLFVADECFLTGSAAEVIPAVKLDGRLIADGKVGPITKRLNEVFKKHVRDDRAHLS